MSWLRILGFGEKKIFAQNLSVAGRITAVKKCWWLKVNTKPVRRDMWDGAKFPHIAHFTYEVDGKAFEGKRWISYRDVPPAVGQVIRVYVDGAHPEKYAVKL